MFDIVSRVRNWQNNTKLTPRVSDAFAATAIFFFKAAIFTTYTKLNYDKNQISAGVELRKNFF